MNRPVKGPRALAWIFVVVPGIGSGLATTIDLLSEAVRRRDVAGQNLAALAAWNTYVEHVYGGPREGRLLRVIPGHLSDLSDSFDGEDREGDDGNVRLV